MRDTTIYQGNFISVTWDGRSELKVYNESGVHIDSHHVLGIRDRQMALELVKEYFYEYKG